MHHIKANKVSSPAIAKKMRLFTALFLITVSTDAEPRRPGKPRPIPAEEYNDKLPQFSFRRDFPDEDRPYSYPVPFGHIFKEGFDNTQPIDLLELDTRYVTDGPYAREFIKKHPNKFMILNEDLARQIIPQQGLTLPIHIEKEEIHGSPIGGESKDNDTISSFWNLEKILERNIEEPPKYRLAARRMPQERNRNVPNIPLDRKIDAFSNYTYDLKLGIDGRIKGKNFTTCDEFGKRAKFHPDDIINIDWVPFYVWAYDNTAIISVAHVHQFSYPTKKFVKKFKEKYGSFLNKTVDWEQPKLILKFGHTALLLIAVNRSGLFDAIPYLNLPSNTRETKDWLKIPTTPLRLKIVDPYLALMFCDQKYAVIMAISGLEPRTPNRCASQAAMLKFKGDGFPVARDMYAEAREARAKIEAEQMAAEFEKPKFINVDK